MTTILGIDLATRRYRDIGIALLYSTSNLIEVRFLRAHEGGRVDPPTVAALVDYICDLASQHDVGLMAVDGPQAWKSPDNGLIHQRLSEKALHTQAKTGLPGFCKPSTSLRFVQFAIEFFAALEQRGWPRQHSARVAETPFREEGVALTENNATLDLQADLLTHSEQNHSKIAIEVFPTAAWRALGLRPLPAKPATSAADVQQWLGHLQQRFPLSLESIPSHDELQALMAGLIGLAVVDKQDYRSFGHAPLLLDGAWREGYIVNFVEQGNNHGNS